MIYGIPVQPRETMPSNLLLTFIDPVILQTTFEAALSNMRIHLNEKSPLFKCQTRFKNVNPAAALRCEKRGL